MSARASARRSPRRARVGPLLRRARRAPGSRPPIGPQDEPRVGESAVAVLSYDYWQREFGGDPAMVDKTVPINGHDLTIVGVAPEGFRARCSAGSRSLRAAHDALADAAQGAARRRREPLLVSGLHFARLKPGVSVEQATAAMNVLLRHHARGRAAAAADGMTADQRDVPRPQDGARARRPGQSNVASQSATRSRCCSA